jgi:putative nucleotidyltransferase with HDIG domain
MRQNLRQGSFLARYGGEEFAIILTDVDENTALRVAERLRNVVQEYPFDGQENLPGENLTISVGVSVYPHKAKTEYELIKGADDACYRAKFMSKNRVEAYYSILEELQNDVDEPDREIVASVKTLIAVINAKDKYTYRHVERVVFYCTQIADKLGLSNTEKKNLVYAAYLHDIGKINIPEDILVKTEKLTGEEWELLKSHPMNAVEIIRNIRVLKDTVPIILQHHERYDGTGYPNRLKGEEIVFLARTLTVVDSFDAMTSLRPYQQKKSYAQAVEELRRCSGTQFDPEISEVFISTIKDMVNK